MKRLLLIVLPLLLNVGCSKPISEETLIEKDGLKYHPETKELYNGKVFQNRMGGGKEFESSYIDGKKDGLWTEWYENEQKMSEGSYIDGKKDGLWTKWYENGNKWTSEYFSNGELNGEYIKFSKKGDYFKTKYIEGQNQYNYEIFNKDDSPKKPISTTETYYEPQRGLSLLKQTHSPFTGIWFRFNELGEKFEGIDFEGKSLITNVFYKTTGELKHKIIYIDEKTYVETGYYKNGNLHYEKKYGKNGIVYEKYFEDGSVKE